MDLQTFIADTGRRKLLADALGKSPDYLWQLGTGWNGRKPSPQLAMEIESATRDLGPEEVRCESLRPDMSWVRNTSGEVTGYHVPLAPSGRAA
ncbi:hypothetical protein [Lysobacter capsici]|uniref:hypothetical protein n=1 Tax=Lysobacter capsici TaxID=435897 RepID=UPI00287B7B1F|nr:hypothetical protein [Lysobacter capsici]WND79416.1 hypothetical protein RJ610_19245 [Lysobacter capsici]WND84612.1 hypothetical protein RJ609_19260 [Lysobacter capsici]